ncbi:MAG: glycerol-3-phosphate dehydrogenase/oxidase [Longimicrobiales bacterium]
MNRDIMVAALGDIDEWDFIVVGGGATGLGVAIDAGSRGYRTLLLEQGDFAQGTSSRSTKLVHGGVRYLQQGNVALVIDALKERGLLRSNAPHLVHNLSFVVPNYEWWEGPFYGIGLKMYDLLAGRQGFGRSKVLSEERTLQLLPTLEPEGLNGGVIYYDGQFDDARLAVNMAQTAAEQGAVVINYARVTGLIKNDDGEVAGVRALDRESGTEHTLRARAVINATGAWTDELRQMDDPSAGDIIRPSQGVHLVLPRDFLPGESAIMVPKTDDGRVLFAIPWLDRVVVGTTDTPVETAELEPVPFEDEVAFLIEHAGRYLSKDPSHDDVLSVFAGIRPLVGAEDADDTASLSRDHTLLISDAGLVTIAGGKWTTYRKMAEDTVAQAAVLADLEDRPCVTHDLNIHGHHANADRFGELASYGSDVPRLRELFKEDAAFAEPLHPAFNTRAGEVVWAARHEMARTVEDVLARRTRALILDARAAMETAPRVAELMAAELGRDADWRAEQVDTFRALAEGYLA